MLTTMTIAVVCMSTSPMGVATSLMLFSLMVSSICYSVTHSIFLSSSVIISFSSGLMLLAFYASTLVPQEFSYSVKVKWALLAMVMTLTLTSESMGNNLMQEMSSMKATSIVVFVMMVLILAMKTINTSVSETSSALKTSF